ncbi:hypothetical protein MMC08_006428 [Hypocenomyce scalaris]|nr:hypothetical protein [Hypocenomyce scalaris]
MTIPEGDPRIRLLRTSHVVYYHPDILKAITFLQDFGLGTASRHGDDEIFFRGYGPTHGVSRFGGAAYLVEPHSKLARAATIPGASPIHALDAPGGGEIVTLTDPVGHQVHLIWGERETAAATPPPHVAKPVVNFEDSKSARGHWYTSTLALAISDIVDVGGKATIAFFHIDR